MNVNDNIIVYDNFRILEEQKYCGLVKYVNIFGAEKSGIILNRVNKIIYNNFHKENYSRYNLNVREKQILKIEYAAVSKLCASSITNPENLLI